MFHQHLTKFLLASNAVNLFVPAQINMNSTANIFYQRALFYCQRNFALIYDDLLLAYSPSHK